MRLAAQVAHVDGHCGLGLLLGALHAIMQHLEEALRLLVTHHQVVERLLEKDRRWRAASAPCLGLGVVSGRQSSPRRGQQEGQGSKSSWLQLEFEDNTQCTGSLGDTYSETG